MDEVTDVEVTNTISNAQSRAGVVRVKKQLVHTNNEQRSKHKSGYTSLIVKQKSNISSFIKFSTLRLRPVPHACAP